MMKFWNLMKFLKVLKFYKNYEFFWNYWNLKFWNFLKYLKFFEIFEILNLKMFTFFCILTLVGRWASPNIPHAGCTHSEVELRKCCLGQSEKSKIPYHLIKCIAIRKNCIGGVIVNHHHHTNHWPHPNITIYSVLVHFV